MRQQTVTALTALADRDYPQRVWIDREYPREGFYDDLTLNVNTLYDMVLPDPQARLGVVLLSESEVALLTALEQVLGPLVDDLRDAPAPAVPVGSAVECGRACRSICIVRHETQRLTGPSPPPRYAQWLFGAPQHDHSACFGAVHLTSNDAGSVDIASMA
ncbi:SCO4402 family protein [Mycolicibacterium sp. P9-22]|uniref:SCO4402 family protein n=1 Tax=Mycolicibacterium sp. P9-22 TaxID=2024613 RepID=UPI001883246A|nr:hypothetical protein [Mycolicibacterium sp. P9-22]